MQRRSVTHSGPGWGAALAAALIVLGTGAATLAAEVFTFRHENVMGTSLELTVRASSTEAAAVAERRVLAEIDRLAAILSNHDPSSDLRRWQAAPAETPVAVPAELLDVLARAERWRVASRGAFDARAAAFSRLWADAARRGVRPESATLRAFADRLHSAPWTLGPAAGTATRRDDLPMTLDGIAKGYIVEHAAAAGLAAAGVKGLLLNVGGDLRAVGSSVAAVGIAPDRDDNDARPPDATVDLLAASLATSGGAYRGVTINGRWYSHLIDPRTGEPVEAVATASVVAPDGADADALATIANVLPPEEAIRLVESVPGASCRIATRDGRVRTSRGWTGRENRPAALVATAFAQGAPAKGAGTWIDRYELAVEFEINRPPAEPGRYRRPYVVVWIEDEAGKTLRTISLWVSLGGAGPDQWLPDLRRWYRGEDQKALSAKKNLIYTIARPTRPPGRYTVVWDGKDDKGRPVPAGRYNVFIEAAREHGTNGLIRTAVPLGEEPFQATLPGNVEIKSATVTVRQKAPTASLVP